MRQPAVDYRTFRLSKLNEPQFAHLKLLGGWIVYFGLYFLTENLIPAERCAIVHCWLDDVIPFDEYFAVFYVGWYVLVFGSLAYYLLYDVASFKKLQIYIMITQAVAMACYILFPTRQDLRPDVFVRENVFTYVIGFIYSFDTSTGVCPSLHVAYSIGILSVFMKDKTVSRLWKGFLTIVVVMISLSVCFVKQHSAVDVLAALPVCALAEYLVYRKYWRQRRKVKSV